MKSPAPAFCPVNEAAAPAASTPTWIMGGSFLRRNPSGRMEKTIVSITNRAMMEPAVYRIFERMVSFSPLTQV